MYKKFPSLIENVNFSSIRQLCQLCLIWPAVLQQILAYALPFVFCVFPCLIFQFPLLKSFQRIHLCANRAVLLCNTLVFCYPTPNIESHPFLAVCHYLLIIFASTLHIWRLSPPSAARWSAVSCYQGGDNCWWFSEAALKFNREFRNCVRFSNATCEMELNVECDSTSTGGTFSPWPWQVLLYCPHFFCTLFQACRFVPELSTTFHVTWGTSVDCSVVIILVEYALCLQLKKGQ